MNRTELYEELLEVLNDSVVNGVWNSSTLWGYLAEGQDKFCEQTGYFKDASNFSLTLQTGVAIYNIPDRIIQIIDIWDGSRKLTKILTGERYLEETTAGDPAYWETDFETGIIKLYPTPTADQNGDTFTLQVWRYSQYDLAEDTRDPEIPSRFQRACIHWAAYQALGHHDMEAEDPIDADKHYSKYLRYVRDGKRALQRYQNQEARVGTDPAYAT
jgi:hypothetical protein